MGCTVSKCRPTRKQRRDVRFEDHEPGGETAPVVSFADVVPPACSSFDIRKPPLPSPSCPYVTTPENSTAPSLNVTDGNNRSSADGVPSDAPHTTSDKTPRTFDSSPRTSDRGNRRSNPGRSSAPSVAARLFDSVPSALPVSAAALLALDVGPLTPSSGTEDSPHLTPIGSHSSHVHSSPCCSDGASGDHEEVGSVPDVVGAPDWQCSHSDGSSTATTGSTCPARATAEGSRTQSSSEILPVVEAPGGAREGGCQARMTKSLDNLRNEASVGQSRFSSSYDSGVCTRRTRGSKRVLTSGALVDIDDDTLFGGGEGAAKGRRHDSFEVVRAGGRRVASQSTISTPSRYGFTPNGNLKVVGGAAVGQGQRSVGSEADTDTPSWWALPTAGGGGRGACASSSSTSTTPQWWEKGDLFRPRGRGAVRGRFGWRGGRGATAVLRNSVDGKELSTSEDEECAITTSDDSGDDVDDLSTSPSTEEGGNDVRGEGESLTAEDAAEEGPALGGRVSSPAVQSDDGDGGSHAAGVLDPSSGCGGCGGSPLPDLGTSSDGDETAVLGVDASTTRGTEGGVCGGSLGGSAVGTAGERHAASTVSRSLSSLADGSRVLGAGGGADGAGVGSVGTHMGAGGAPWGGSDAPSGIPSVGSGLLAAGGVECQLPVSSVEDACLNAQSVCSRSVSPPSTPGSLPVGSASTLPGVHWREEQEHLTSSLSEVAVCDIDGPLCSTWRTGGELKVMSGSLAETPVSSAAQRSAPSSFGRGFAPVLSGGSGTSREGSSLTGSAHTRSLRGGHRVSHSFSDAFPASASNVNVRGEEAEVGGGASQRRGGSRIEDRPHQAADAVDVSGSGSSLHQESSPTAANTRSESLPEEAASASHDGASDSSQSNNVAGDSLSPIGAGSTFPTSDREPLVPIWKGVPSVTTVGGGGVGGVVAGHGLAAAIAKFGVRTVSPEPSVALLSVTGGHETMGGREIKTGRTGSLGEPRVLAVGAVCGGLEASFARGPSADASCDSIFPVAGMPDATSYLLGGVGSSAVTVPMVGSSHVLEADLGDWVMSRGCLQGGSRDVVAKSALPGSASSSRRSRQSPSTQPSDETPSDTAAGCNSGSARRARRRASLSGARHASVSGVSGLGSVCASQEVLLHCRSGNSASAAACRVVTSNCGSASDCASISDSELASNARAHAPHGLSTDGSACSSVPSRRVVSSGMSTPPTDVAAGASVTHSARPAGRSAQGCEKALSLGATAEAPAGESMSLDRVSVVARELSGGEPGDVGESPAHAHVPRVGSCRDEVGGAAAGAGADEADLVDGATHVEAVGVSLAPARDDRSCVDLVASSSSNCGPSGGTSSSEIECGALPSGGVGLCGSTKEVGRVGDVLSPPTSHSHSSRSLRVGKERYASLRIIAPPPPVEFAEAGAPPAGDGAAMTACSGSSTMTSGIGVVDAHVSYPLLGDSTSPRQEGKANCTNAPDGEAPQVEEGSAVPVGHPAVTVRSCPDQSPRGSGDRRGGTEGSSAGSPTLRSSGSAHESSLRGPPVFVRSPLVARRGTAASAAGGSTAADAATASPNRTPVYSCSRSSATLGSQELIRPRPSSNFGTSPFPWPPSGKLSNFMPESSARTNEGVVTSSGGSGGGASASVPSTAAAAGAAVSTPTVGRGSAQVTSSCTPPAIAFTSPSGATFAAAVNCYAHGNLRGCNLSGHSDATCDGTPLTVWSAFSGPAATATVNGSVDTVGPVSTQVSTGPLPLMVGGSADMKLGGGRPLRRESDVLRQFKPAAEGAQCLSASLHLRLADTGVYSPSLGRKRSSLGGCEVPQKGSTRAQTEGKGVAMLDNSADSHVALKHAASLMTHKLPRESVVCTAAVNVAEGRRNSATELSRGSQVDVSSDKASDSQAANTSVPAPLSHLVEGERFPQAAAHSAVPHESSPEGARSAGTPDVFAAAKPHRDARSSHSGSGDSIPTVGRDPLAFSPAGSPATTVVAQNPSTVSDSVVPLAGGSQLRSSPSDGCHAVKDGARPSPTQGVTSRSPVSTSPSVPAFMSAFSSTAGGDHRAAAGTAHPDAGDLTPTLASVGEPPSPCTVLHKGAMSPPVVSWSHLSAPTAAGIGVVSPDGDLADDEGAAAGGLVEGLEARATPFFPAPSQRRTVDLTNESTTLSMYGDRSAVSDGDEGEAFGRVASGSRGRVASLPLPAGTESLLQWSTGDEGTRLPSEMSSSVGTSVSTVRRVCASSGGGDDGVISPTVYASPGRAERGRGMRAGQGGRAGRGRTRSGEAQPVRPN